MGDVAKVAYEADLHCVNCARLRFGNPDNATDREGNEVHPIFVSDEHSSFGEFCSDCNEEIWTPECLQE